jgi:hypothetical protein
VQGISIPTDENIALLDPSSLPGAIRVYTDDDEPLGFREPRRVGNGLIDPHRLEAESQIAASDPAMGEQLLCHALERLGWDDQNPPPGAEHCHSEDLPIGVESDSSLRSGVEFNIQMDSSVDMAAAEASPWAACKSHNAESGAHSLGLTTSRKHKMSGAEPGRVCEGNIGDGLLLRPQEGNVCTWITADETCGDLVSVRMSDQNILIRFQRFFCGEDQSGTPDDACRGPVSWAMDDHKPRRDSVAKVGDAI